MGMPGVAPRARGAGRAASMGRENGSVAIMTIGALVVIIGFCGLALDLSQIYNRRIELQNVADVSALAAARELNGTRAGVAAATQAAAARFQGPAPIALTYQYGRATMAWSDAAIQFGPTPAGPWQSAASALNSPDGLLFAKVSSNGLDAAYGDVNATFIPFFAADLRRVATRARAVAGRTAIKVAPLGICAMRPEQKRNRSGELEEYGFRRGIAYDLMQLNPEATGAGQTFLIDPVAPLNAGSGPASSLSTVQAFVCTGTLGIPRVTGGKVSVSSPFPLSSLVSHLNSRFDASAACSASLAPPDANVKSYDAGTSVPWMTTAPTGQAAALSLADGKRWTVAGPDPTPGTTTGPMYGPLWSYAKAVQYAATEPASGYTAYSTSNWNTLYNPGQPKASGSYPATTPYAQASGANFKAPTGPQKGVRNRRVLNVALLSCPVSGSRATVLGVGRFFMTVPADSTHLYAEFAGLVPEQSLNIQMTLYP